MITGCETEVKDIRLPEFRPKLVVTCFLSPSDTISYFNVSTNASLFGELNKIEPFGNLSGYISDGSQTVYLDTFSTGLKLDHKKMPIRYGSNYSLTISSDLGLKAEAVCTIPQERVFSIETDTFSVPVNNPWAGSKRRIDLKIAVRDIAGENNYYRIKARGYGYFRHQQSNETIRFNKDLRIIEDFFTDQGVDGSRIILVTEQGMQQFFDSDSSFVVITLYNTENSYYLYHKSLRNYNDGRSPFEEATPVFTNVTGGLGIFTSYTVDSTVVRIK
jgi:hypothetical protein